MKFKGRGKADHSRPFDVHSIEDLERLQEQAWDKYIAGNSRFESWDEMQESAGDTHIPKPITMLFRE